MIVFLLVVLHVPGLISAQSVGPGLLKKGYTLEQYSHKDLKQWAAYGIGGMEANHGQTAMYELEGSLGYMLVSPESYRSRTIISYEVMALTAGTVLIVEMAAHNRDDLSLDLEADYDGNVRYLFENVSMYMFAFHNAAHNKTGPFVRKYPLPGGESLVSAAKNLMQVGKYHHVEIGVEGGKLWFRLDGKMVWKVEDPTPIQGGKVILRIRGTAREKASCLIKNLKIYSKD